MTFLLAVIYLAFISLGLPDALLGAAWPTMHQDFGVSLSYAGAVSMIISVNTIISSLQSDRLTRKFGTGMVTAVSVALTAIALFGFSISSSFWMICLWAIPYGLGAGSVDSSLNNYVALHYESKHMSWLHCMWGIGATVGPYIMGAALTGGTWHSGYRIVSLIQIVLTGVIFYSLPKWKKSGTQESHAETGKALRLIDVPRIPGVKAAMCCFFAYCMLEQTAILWASSYLNLVKDMSAERAAWFASMFCLGITIGRGISGFVSMKLTDDQLIRLSEVILLFGIIIIFLPFGSAFTVIGFSLVGLGCAPIFPCLIHETPDHFGADRSQAVIAVQMASAYVGTCLMPPLFGLIANNISIRLLPAYLLMALALMAVMFEVLKKKVKRA